MKLRQDDPIEGLREDTPMQIDHYQQPNGRYPVKDFISKIPDGKHVAELGLRISSLEDFYDLNPKIVKKLHMSEPLWELRYKTYRIIFCSMGNRIVLLHGFVKKSNETPRRELEVAKKRYRTLC